MNIDIIKYLVNFLAGRDCFNRRNGIAYTEAHPGNVEGSLIIRPSGFFNDDAYGTSHTIPKLPLKQIDGMPILYGEPVIENYDGKFIIHADLIASAFFLVSRYEEIIRTDARDLHGRFPGRESLPFRAGFIDRPILDEYGNFLRELLRKTGAIIEDRQPGFSSIYLTHDIDYPWENFDLIKAGRRIFGTLKREGRLNIYPLLNCFGIVDHDPIYTFREIMKLDEKVRTLYKDICKVVYFVKSGGSLAPQDSFVYINSNACKKMITEIKSSGAKFGYHASYEAGISPSLMVREINTLEKVLGEKIRFNRNHYLSSREPGDMRLLMDEGITDDFTMGYADVAGFRLGTSRCVRWIDPERVKLTELRLHPLTIMECSLSDRKYMNLSESEASKYAKKLILETRKNNGELTLLWHNTTLIDTPDNRDRRLYETIIRDLCDMI